MFQNRIKVKRLLLLLVRRNVHVNVLTDYLVIVWRNYPECPGTRFQQTKFRRCNKEVITQFLIGESEIGEVRSRRDGCRRRCCRLFSTEVARKSQQGPLRHDFEIRLTDILPSLFKQTVASHETTADALGSRLLLRVTKVKYIHSKCSVSADKKIPACWQYEGHWFGLWGRDL